MEGTIGEVRLFAGKFAPSGWLLCDGRFLNISQHQVLYSVIGTNYGGDGRNTFQLPDLRNRLAIGTQNEVSVGFVTGSDKVILNQGNLPAKMLAELKDINGRISGTASGTGSAVIAIPSGNTADSASAEGKYIGPLDGLGSFYSDMHTENMASFNVDV